jgi:Spy/CpxP family protein refolding chaperone
MRTLLATVLVVVAATLCPTLRAGGGESLAERIQDLNLTDAQEAKIADIRKDCRTKIQQTDRELATLVKEEVDKIRDVLTVAQKQKLQDLKEEREERRLEGGLAQRVAHLKELDLSEDEVTKIQSIQREERPRVVRAMETLKGLLTEQQRKAREQGLSAGKTRREVLTSLNLTPDQKQKVETAAKDVGAVVRDELEKIKDVLTASQQEKLGELKEERREHVRDHMAHRVANFKELNLTPDQKTKIDAIRQEFRPRIHEAGNRMRAEIRQELEMILAVIKG